MEALGIVGLIFGIGEPFLIALLLKYTPNVNGIDIISATKTIPTLF
ncbi:MAG: hypothetical protein ACI8PF_000641 [Flavobacteriaceae bacterium]|jgi:hypothetical protein|tara:strand:+ start:604 stop:741 length:138 start_codon:yes stop_codon:yes gene_type:complete